MLQKLLGSGRALNRRLWAKGRFCSWRDWAIWNYDAAVRVFPRLSLGKAPFHLRIKGQSAPITLRRFTTDGYVFDEVFVRGIYDFVWQTVGPQALVVVDLGANSGLSLRLWADKFPLAILIGVEPDAGNFASAERNLASIKNPMHLVRACVGDVDGKATLCKTGFEAGFFVESDESPPTTDQVEQRVDVDAVSMKTLLDKYVGDKPITLLKCDIEGAESRVFRECRDWLHRVNFLMIELHGEYTVDRFMDDLKRNGGDFEILSKSLNVTYSMIFLRQRRPA